LLSQLIESVIKLRR